jgi:hypothetical protein
MLKNNKNYINNHKKSALAFVAIVFSGIGTKYLPGDLDVLTKKVKTSESTIEHANVNVKKPLIDQTEFRYLGKSPILDGALYVERYYNAFIFGGVNFSQLSIAARSNMGDIPRELKIESSRLQASTVDQPYIEFTYKGKYYAIQFSMGIYDLSHPNNINYYYQLFQINKPTMQLIKVE